jgi:hypothetical protein
MWPLTIGGYGLTRQLPWQVRSAGLGEWGTARRLFFRRCMRGQCHGTLAVVPRCPWPMII